MWAGVCVIALGISLVGVSSTLGGEGGEGGGSGEGEGMEALLGIGLTLAGTLMQSFQYVYEEKIMNDVSCPPLLLIGTEGVFGAALCALVLYPLAYAMPGADHGRYEDFTNTWYKLTHDGAFAALVATYCVLIFILNSLSVVITYMLSSVWHAILDNFRPISVWFTALYLYYVVSDGEQGEPWLVPGSWLQATGTLVLLYGTAVYNGSVPAPCAGVPRPSTGLGEALLDEESSVPPSRAVLLATFGASPFMTRSPLLAAAEEHPDYALTVPAAMREAQATSRNSRLSASRRSRASEGSHIPSPA